MKKGDKIIVHEGADDELITEIDHIDGEKYYFKDKEGKIWFETVDAITQIEEL
jgi:hypothetical protein